MTKETQFTLTAKFDRNLAWSAGGSVRYLVASLQAVKPKSRGEGTTARAPLNVTLAIDASGSMQDGRLDAAKAATLGLLDRLTDEVRARCYQGLHQPHVLGLQRFVAQVELDVELQPRRFAQAHDFTQLAANQHHVARREGCL